MQRKRILIADNDPSEIQELRQSLVGAGYEVRIADNGAGALKLCREFRPHLVFSEVQLPKIDGHHLLRELRSQSATKSIPFVLMSRHRPVEDRVHSIKLGVDDYISKPFDVNEVLVRFETVLREVDSVKSTAERKGKGFSGKLNEINLIDLLRTLDIGKKTGVIKLQADSKEGTVFIKKGEVYDISLEDLKPKEALFRMFTWSEGTFRVDLKELERPNVVKESVADLIYQGLTYRERWKEISKKLPHLQTMVKRNPNITDDSLSADEQSLIHLINGKKKFIDLIEQSKFDALKALKILYNLYSRGSLVEVSLEEDFTNGSSLMNDNQSSKNTEKSRLNNLITRFLIIKEENLNRRQVERRRVERRHSTKRRSRTRRGSDVVGRQNKIYLNKSELLMIRERLSQGLNSEDNNDILF